MYVMYIKKIVSVIVCVQVNIEQVVDIKHLWTPLSFVCVFV